MFGIVLVTTLTFNQMVLQVRDRPVVVYFLLAEAHQLDAMIRELALTHPDIPFLVLDCRASPEIAMRYQVREAPAVGIFRDGRLEWLKVFPCQLEIEKALPITVSMR